MRINDNHGGRRSKRKVVRSDGVTFGSIAEAALESDTYPEDIGLCCRGKRNFAGGYRWSYAEEAASDVNQL